MEHYIKSMSAVLRSARGYGNDGFELAVTVSFDAKLFNKYTKNKKTNPLEVAMAQIKNVVYDATGVRGVPSYSPPSMGQQWPRASRGKKTLTIYFKVNNYIAAELGVKDPRFSYGTHILVELNKILEGTRSDGHLFAKTAMSNSIGGH